MPQGFNIKKTDATITSAFSESVSKNNQVKENQVSVSIWENPTDLDRLFFDAPEIPLTYNDVKQYSKEGHSAQETYEYLKKGIDKAKNNPNALDLLVSSTLHDFSSKYDSNKSFGKIAESNENVLNSFIKADDKVDNAICTTIHGFMVDTLNECGIPAVLTSGQQTSGHATLLYKTGNGNYVWNNYGTSYEIKADNVTDAVKKINRLENPNKNRSYISLLGGGELNNYNEYAYRKEAAFGEEIDEANIDKESAFTKESPTETTVSYSTGTSSHGKEFDSKVTVANKKKDFNVSLEVQKKENGETEMFDRSESSGVKVGIVKEYKDKNNDGSTNLSGQILYNNVKGEINDKKISANLIQEKLGVVRQDDLYHNDKIKVTNSAKVKQQVTVPLDGSLGNLLVRGVLEDGVLVQNKLNPKTELSTGVSGGAFVDLHRKNYYDQSYGFAYGYKGNIQTALSYTPSNQIAFTAQGDMYLAKTKNLAHYGGGIRFNTKYTPKKNLDINAGIAATLEKKDLNLGLFNENIQNRKIMTAYGDVTANKDLTIFGNYSHDFSDNDNIFNLGIKYNF